MPAVDRRVKLHAGIAALPGSLGDLLHEVAGFVAFYRLVGDAGLGPPVAVVTNGFHEVVGRANTVIRVLEKDGAVRFAVERGIVAGVDERVSLLLFLSLAPDESF